MLVRLFLFCAVFGFVMPLSGQEKCECPECSRKNAAWIEVAHALVLRVASWIEVDCRGKWKFLGAGTHTRDQANISYAPVLGIAKGSQEASCWGLPLTIVVRLICTEVTWIIVRQMIRFRVCFKLSFKCNLASFKLQVPHISEMKWILRFSSFKVIWEVLQIDLFFTTNNSSWSLWHIFKLHINIPVKVSKAHCLLIFY